LNTTEDFTNKVNNFLLDLHLLLVEALLVLVALVLVALAALVLARLFQHLEEEEGLLTTFKVLEQPVELLLKVLKRKWTVQTRCGFQALVVAKER
jgi:hypothetical protein